MTPIEELALAYSSHGRFRYVCADGPELAIDTEPGSRLIRLVTSFPPGMRPTRQNWTTMEGYERTILRWKRTGAERVIREIIDSGISSEEIEDLMIQTVMMT